MGTKREFAEDPQSSLELPRSGGLDAAGGTGDDGPAAYTPQVPYALTSQSVLSEDYFEVVNHSIDTSQGDKVFAYTRADGQVEAMVLQDGVVKQIFRDVTQPGGWNVYALPGAEGVADMVAGVAQPNKNTAPYLAVYYTKATQPDRLVVASQPVTAASAPRRSWLPSSAA
jgi:hypothetical protein